MTSRTASSGTSTTTASTTPAGPQLAATRAKRGRPHLLTWVSGVLLGGLLFLALFPQLATNQDPAQQDLRNRLAPPAWRAEGSWAHPLGTDHLGRDLWARIVYGARVSVVIAGGAVLVAGALGTVLGLVAGYAGGAVDEVIMRIADIQLAFSPILLVIAIMAVIGPGLQNMILVLGIVSWVQYARVVRGETLLARETPYIEAARSVGLHSRRILWRHIFPNVAPSLLVIATVNASQQILNEAALSFLGLGVQPPTPAWGSMLAEGQSYFRVAWWNAVYPGLAILLAVLGINLLGDRLAERR
jgi:ABC-type dipeptide/oligopeptide/nickel transport system permease subunit